MTLASVLPAAAESCNPANLVGAYGFQLSGSTTISGDAKPVASIGRIEFDGGSALSGTASVNFAGYFLGNPVTGSYEAKADCSIAWTFQDDSGGFQHFAGSLTPDLQRGTFRQTDSGGARNGALVKMPSQCSIGDLQGSYNFSITGGAIPMLAGDIAHKISYQGSLTADANGNLVVDGVNGGSGTPGGTASVDPTCFVQISLIPSPGTSINLRGVLVAGGKEIMVIETDPGTTVNGRFRVR